VNHDILLQKLNHYGVRGIGNSWVHSYLSDRSQFCTFGDKISSTTKITCGVPQGSILGPLLFLIYINDLGNIFNHFETILFADDSNLIIKGKSILSIEQKINQDIPLLTSWLQTNRLSLNVSKTHIMVFGKKNKNKENHISTTIEGTTLEVVTQTKCLGINLDNELSWKYHALHISKKIAKSIGIPYLTYCSVIWGMASDNILWPIFRTQKRAIRIIDNLRGRTSTKSTFYKYQILRLLEIYKYSALIFVYKYKNDLLPNTFNEF
jgi:hypothetical protein